MTTLLEMIPVKIPLPGSGETSLQTVQIHGAAGLLLADLMAAATALLETTSNDHEAAMAAEGEAEIEYHENDCSACRAIREMEETLGSAKRVFILPDPPPAADAPIRDWIVYHLTFGGVFDRAGDGFIRLYREGYYLKATTKSGHWQYDITNNMAANLCYGSTAFPASCDDAKRIADALINALRDFVIRNGR